MRLFIRAGLTLGLMAMAASACKESIAPKSLANPQQTTEQMNAFDTLFNVPILNSFSALSIEMMPISPMRVRELRSLVAATNPLNRASALRPYAQGYETSRMLQRVIPTMLNASAEDIFPPETDGLTFEWDTTGIGSYQPTARTGAPATGVRFILYAVNGLTGLPTEPLTEVGYVDLADESTASVAKLHVTVAGVSGTPVYINYTTTLQSLGESSARIGTAGYVTNGASSPDTLRFTGTINVSGSANGFSVTQDVSFDVNSHDAHVRLWERVTFTSSTANLRIFFLFKHGIEIVTLEGEFNLDTIGEAVDGNITVKVDGGLFATCDVVATPTSYNLTCEGADADGLNAAEVEALDQIGDALSNIEAMVAGLMNPGVNVLGGN